MPMKKTIGFAALIICLLVNCFPANGATNDFTVQLHGERLTLSAEKTPLRAILTKLAFRSFAQTACALRWAKPRKRWQLRSLSTSLVRR